MLSPQFATFVVAALLAVARVDGQTSLVAGTVTAVLTPADATIKTVIYTNPAPAFANITSATQCACSTNAQASATFTLAQASSINNIQVTNAASVTPSANGTAITSVTLNAVNITVTVTNGGSSTGVCTSTTGPFSTTTNQATWTCNNVVGNVITFATSGTTGLAFCNVLIFATDTTVRKNVMATGIDGTVLLATLVVGSIAASRI